MSNVKEIKMPSQHFIKITKCLKINPVHLSTLEASRICIEMASSKTNEIYIIGMISRLARGFFNKLWYIQKRLCRVNFAIVAFF